MKQFILEKDIPILNKKQQLSLINFCISCLHDNEGNSLGLHDHLGDIADWAIITLKKCGLNEKEINKIIDMEGYEKEEYECK